MVAREARAHLPMSTSPPAKVPELTCSPVNLSWPGVYRVLRLLGATTDSMLRIAADGDVDVARERLGHCTWKGVSTTIFSWLCTLDPWPRQVDR